MGLSANLLFWILVALPIPLCGSFAWLFLEQARVQTSASEKLIGLQYVSADLTEGMTQFLLSGHGNPVFDRERGLLLFDHMATELNRVVAALRDDGNAAVIAAVKELEQDSLRFQASLQQVSRATTADPALEERLHIAISRLQLQVGKLRAVIRDSRDTDFARLQHSLYITAIGSIIVLLLVAIRLRRVTQKQAQTAAEKTKAVAAQNESDRRLRGLLETTTENVWLADARFSDFFFDPPMQFGNRPAQAAWSGEEWIKVVHPDDRDMLRKASAAAFHNKGNFRVDYRVEGPDGTWRWLHVRAIAELDAAGAVASWHGIAFDITQRYAVEEQLRHAHKMEAIGQLTGGIAHDFNNLLAVILGNLELLHEQIADPKQRELTGSAIRAAERGSDLTHQLLAFGRRQSLRPIVVDLTSHIPGLLNLLRRTLGQRIEVVLSNYAEELPVLVDVTQLETSILNLAINARDAMDHVGRLTLSLGRVSGEAIHSIGLAAAEKVPDSSQTYAMFALTDTGSGMAEDVLERAFDPFFTTKAVGGGSGLGLSMVHGFVRQSQGHIAVESRIGRGTTIKIFLPILQAGQQAQPSIAAPVAAIQAPTQYAILLVEDDAAVGAVISQMLADMGHAVTAAADATEAMAILQSGQPFDLLITDIQMPGPMSGVDLVDQAVALNLISKAIFISGSEPPAEALKRLAGKDRPFVKKPIRKADLAKAIATKMQQELVA
jgi:PAS domain S-box-containing protein